MSPGKKHAAREAEGPSCCFFLDSFLVEIFLNFVNRQLSTPGLERYSGYKRFWVEHTFFLRQSHEKNRPESAMKKNILKIKFSKQKL